MELRALSRVFALGILFLAGLLSGASRTLSAADSVEIGGESFSFTKDAVIRGFDLPCRSFQIWGDYYVGSGSISPKNLDGGYSFDTDLDGAQIGLNIGLGSAFLATIYYNYQGSELEADSEWGDSDFPSYLNKAKTHLGGIGLRYNTSGFYFSLIGNYGIDDYDLTSYTYSETETFSGLAEKKAGYDGWQAGGSFETGYMMSTGLFDFKPFGNWQYSYLKADGIDYKAAAYKDDKFGADALFQTLGARIDVDFSLVTLQGRLGWVHQYLSSAPINNYLFSRTSGTYTPSTCFFEGSSGSDYFWGGAGIKLSLFGTIAASLDYDVLLNHYQTTHLGSVGLLWSF